MSVQVTRLSNGLTVATHRMEHLQSAALGIWVGAGSRSERDDEHGMAHLLEHMAFKGTETRSAMEIAEEIEAVGGELNAATSIETTHYYARVLKEDVPLAVDILTDILRHSVVDEEELAREQHVIVQEIGASLDQPEDRVMDLFTETAFPNQPIGRPILGTEETVRGMRRQGILDYLDRHYRGPGMVLAGAGAVDHDAFVAMAERGLSDVPGSAGPRPLPARYGGGDNRDVKKDQKEAQILLGFAGRPFASPDFQAAQVLSAVLGGGMSSRLFQEVREKRGLCYSVYAFHWAFMDGGVFAVNAATGESDVDELVPVILGELERASHDVTEAEVARAKAQMRAGLLMALESSASRAGQIARQILIYGRPLPLEEIVARIDAVTPEAVKRMASAIFTGTPPTVAALGPVGRMIGYDRIAERLGSPAAA